MRLGGGEDAVAGTEVQSGEARVAAVRGRAGERDVGRVGVQDPRVAGALAGAELKQRLHVVASDPAVIDLIDDPL